MQGSGPPLGHAAARKASTGRWEQPQPLLPVGGRLAHFKVQWLSITSSKFVLQCLKGLPLELTDRPPQGPWNRKFDSASGLSDIKKKALAKEVKALQAKQAIERVPRTKGFYARVFLVPKKGGSYRPVFNLRPLNQSIAKKKFKMATVKTVASAIRPGDFAVSIDLKDAYLHVPVLSAHRKFLKFTFQGVTYQFKVLPFGLSSAPRTFTKMTRVVILYCRALGIRLIFYLDDGLLLARPRQLAANHRDILVGLVLDLGWVVNWEKSELCPSQDFSYVGLHWSSLSMTVSLPDDKLLDLQSRAKQLLDAPRPPTCRRLQQFLGKGNFASLALPRARLHLRALQRDLHRSYSTRSDLFKPCPLSPQSREDLEWWTSPPLNGLPLVPPLPSVSISTDASTKGWGAHWGESSLAGTWSPQDSRLHINCLEMKAVILTFKAWGSSLRGKVVALHCDNKAVVAYLMKEGGTKSPGLCHLTRILFSLLDKWAISLRPAYLRGIANIEADSLSRGKQLQEWCLLPQVASQIFTQGRPRWDLFASQASAQADRFFSIDSRDSSQGMDALLQDWASLRGPLYAFPPPQLIPQTLSKVVVEQIDLTLIAPCWEDSGKPIFNLATTNFHILSICAIFTKMRAQISHVVTASRDPLRGSHKVRAL